VSGAYYNENDPAAAAWLRELIRRGLIADGEVDTRSIEDVRPIDLRGFVQCHFFAGIGGWSRALRLAGWPDDRSVWTGSCPCQPFSDAGPGQGFADKRHLWPAWLHLIAQCQPAVIVGEQFASAAALQWWDLVSVDLEGQGYACAAADLCAAGIGAPHIRQRLCWVADSGREGLAQRGRIGGIPGGTTGGTTGANARQAAERNSVRNAGRLANADGGYTGAERQQRGWEQRQQPQDGRAVDGLADADGSAIERVARELSHKEGQDAGRRGDGLRGVLQVSDALPTHGFWRTADWLGCRDGKWRPVEPGTFPLAHGLPARVGRLRGYGNAIVPQVAAEFVAAYLETQSGPALFRQQVSA